MKRTLIAVVAGLAVASGANALSVDVDSDKLTYLVGETITVTVTIDTAGAAVQPPTGGETAAFQITWADAIADALGAGAFGNSSQIITSGANAGNSNLTSLSGNIPWTGPATTGCVSLGPGAGNTCNLINQSLIGLDFAPDASILVGTLELTAVALGSLNFGTGVVDVWGATPNFGSNFQGAVVVPEPTTAALFGLGLLGLTFVGRRR